MPERSPISQCGRAGKSKFGLLAPYFLLAVVVLALAHGDIRLRKVGHALHQLAQPEICCRRLLLERLALGLQRLRLLRRPARILARLSQPRDLRRQHIALRLQRLRLRNGVAPLAIDRSKSPSSAAGSIPRARSLSSTRGRFPRTKPRSSITPFYRRAIAPAPAGKALKPTPRNPVYPVSMRKLAFVAALRRSPSPPDLHTRRPMTPSQSW